MNKLLLLLFLSAITLSAYSQDLIYNCRLDVGKKVEVKDNIKRTIKKIGKTLTFENYYTNSTLANEKDLVLHIDSVVNKKREFGLKKQEDWYYCTCDLGFKYIVLGLGSSNISLYQIFSEIDVFEEQFSSLKQ